MFHGNIVQKHNRRRSTRDKSFSKLIKWTASPTLYCIGLQEWPLLSMLSKSESSHILVRHLRVQHTVGINKYKRVNV